MTMSRMGRHFFWLWMALLFLVGGPLMADDGSIVLGRRERGPFLTLDPFEGNLQLGGIFGYESSRSSGSTAESTSTMLNQSLSLSTGGGVVSRNFLDWHASGTIGVEEEWDHTSTQNGSTVGLFDAYNVHAAVLRTSDLPFTFFAQRGQSYVNRAFASLLRNTTTSYGGTVNWRSGVLPMDLRIAHTNTLQEDLRGNLQYEVDEDQLEYQTEFQPNENNDFTLHYEFHGVDQNNPHVLNNVYNLQNLSLTHDWGIDAERRFILSQRLNYTDQTGSFPYAQIRLDERLRMRLAEALDGNLTYNFSHQDYATSTTDAHNVSAGLSHHLFESLSTTAQGGYSTRQTSFTGNQQGESSAQSYFGGLGVNYTKKIPPGRLSARLSAGYNQTDNSAVGGTQQVIGDVQSFNDPQPVSLTRSGISAASITVYDAAGTQQLVEGLDYTVQTVGNTIEIQRLVGGRINDGDTVRLNYDILPLPGYISETTSFSTGLRYDFQEGLLEGLSIFANYAQVDQNISPPTTVIRANNVRDTTVGATYRVWKLMLSAEQQWRQSDLAPYESSRLSARYSDRLSDRTTLSLGVTENYIHHSRDGATSNLVTLDGRLEYSIARDLRATMLARWRQDDNSRIGRSTAFEAQAGLRWSIRQTDLSLNMRYTKLDSGNTDTNSLFLQFGVARNF
jgi:hypothetical protein